MQALRKNNSFYFLSKKQTVILRAFAIILIVLHNYVKYLLPGFPIGENEFSFSSSYVIDYFHFFLEKPYYLIEILLAFWGHYGVQIFIFISGYGLTRMFNLNGFPCIFKYLIKYYLKLYTLLLFGVISCVSFFVFFKTEGSIEDFIFNVLSPFDLLLLRGNNGGFGIFIGSWWYFGLVFQLYTIFPLLYLFITRVKYNFISFGILIVAYLFVSYFVLYYLNDEYLIRFQKTIFGHIPEVALGILLASTKKMNFSKFLISACILIFILSNFLKFFFPLSFFAVLILLLYIFRVILFHKSLLENKSLLYIGEISMMLFLFNSFVRVFALEFLPTIPLLSMIMYFIALLIFCSIAYFIFKNTFLKIEYWLLKKIKLYK